MGRKVLGEKNPEKEGRFAMFQGSRNSPTKCLTKTRRCYESSRPVEKRYDVQEGEKSRQHPFSIQGKHHGKKDDNKQ